eukprot:g1607.t1
MPEGWCEHINMIPSVPLPEEPVTNPRKCCMDESKSAQTCDDVDEYYCDQFRKVVNARPPAKIRDKVNDCCSFRTCDRVDERFCLRLGSNMIPIVPKPDAVYSYADCCGEKPLDCSDAEQYCRARDLGARAPERRPSLIQNKDTDCCFPYTCDIPSIRGLCVQFHMRKRTNAPRGPVGISHLLDTCCEELSCNDARETCARRNQVLKVPTPASISSLEECCEDRKHYCREIKCSEHHQFPADAVPTGPVDDLLRDCCQPPKCAKFGPTLCTEIDTNWVAKEVSPTTVARSLSRGDFLRDCCEYRPIRTCQGVATLEYCARLSTEFEMIPKDEFPSASRTLNLQDCCMKKPLNCDDRKTFCIDNERMYKAEDAIPSPVTDKLNDCCYELTCATHGPMFCTGELKPKASGASPGRIHPSKFYDSCCEKAKQTFLCSAPAVKKSCEDLGQIVSPRAPTTPVEDISVCCIDPPIRCDERIGKTCYGKDLAPKRPMPAGDVESEDDCCEPVTCAKFARSWCQGDYVPKRKLSNVAIRNVRDNFHSECCLHRPVVSCSDAETFCPTLGKIPMRPTPTPSRDLRREDCCVKQPLTCDDAQTFCYRQGLHYRSQFPREVTDKVRDCCYEISCKIGIESGWCAENGQFPNPAKEGDSSRVHPRDFYDTCCVKRKPLTCEDAASFCPEAGLVPKQSPPAEIRDKKNDCCEESPVKCSETFEQETAFCLHSGLRARELERRPRPIRNRERDCCVAFTCESDAEEYCSLFNRIPATADVPDGPVMYPDVFFETCCVSRAWSCDDPRVPKICQEAGGLVVREDPPLRVENVIDECCVEKAGNVVLRVSTDASSAPLTCGKFQRLACRASGLVPRDDPPEFITHVLRDCCTSPPRRSGVTPRAFHEEDCSKNLGRGWRRASPRPCPEDAPCLSPDGLCYTIDGKIPNFVRDELEWMPQEHLWPGQERPVNFDPRQGLTEEECDELGVPKVICSSMFAASKDSFPSFSVDGAIVSDPDAEDRVRRVYFSDATFASSTPNKYVVAERREFRRPSPSKRLDALVLTTRTGQREKKRTLTVRGGSGGGQEQGVIDPSQMRLRSLIGTARGSCEAIDFKFDAQQNIPSTKANIMWTVPEILVVPYNRRKFTRTGVQVTYDAPWLSDDGIPRTLDLIQRVDGHTCRMRLVSMSAYQPGHYTAYVLRGGAWWHMNDARAAIRLGDENFAIEAMEQVRKQATTFVYEKVVCVAPGGDLNEAADTAVLPPDPAPVGNQKPKGIPNRGNTCWFSSLLQCLVASPKFRTALQLSGAELVYPEKTDLNVKQQNFTKVFVRVMRSLATYGTGEGIDGTDIVRAVKAIDAIQGNGVPGKPNILGRTQAADEYMGIIFDALHEALRTFDGERIFQSKEMGILKASALHQAGLDAIPIFDEHIESPFHQFEVAYAQKFLEDYDKYMGVSPIRDAVYFITEEIKAAGAPLEDGRFPACLPRGEADKMYSKFVLENTVIVKAPLRLGGGRNVGRGVDQAPPAVKSSSPVASGGARAQTDDAEWEIVKTHITMRFKLLESIMKKEARWKLRIPPLGQGEAKSAWTKKNHDNMIALFRERVSDLKAKFPGRVNERAFVGDFTTLKEKNCDASQKRKAADKPGLAPTGGNWLDVWGANDRNWNFAPGTPGPPEKGPWGVGQASCFESQRKGVFGIVTMPTTNRKSTSEADKTYGA